MKTVKTIAAFFLAGLVILSSTSFLVGVHFCAGAVKEVAFLSKADGCNHKDVPPCHRKAMEDCCNDLSVLHSADGVFYASCSSEFASDGAGFESVVPFTFISMIIPRLAGEPPQFYCDHIPIRALNRPVVHRALLI